MKFTQKPISVLTVLLVAFASSCAQSAEKVSILRTGRAALVRCPFSETEDLVVQVKTLANEWAYIVPKTSRTEDYAKGELIHSGGDDFVATEFGGFGYLSGNHGSAYAALQTVPNHGLTTNDIGSVAVHESKTRFVIAAVPDANHLLLHPEGKPGVYPSFVYQDKGRFTCGEKSWEATASVRNQLYPMNRFRRFIWKTAEGKDVPDGREVTSTRIDLEIEHDVLDPRGVMDYLKTHGAASRSFGVKWEQAMCETPEATQAAGDFMKIPALMSVRTTYSYDGSCCRLARRRTTFVTPVPSATFLDLCYCWENSWKDVLCYIPRLKPVTLKGMGGAPDVSCDFTAGVQMPTPAWKVGSTIKREDSTDPANPPDRFIRVMSRPGRRVGLSLGYSLTEGVSALGCGWPNRKSLYFFWWTGKMYPYLMTLTNIKAGSTYEHCAYTQYFNPAREPDATAFYSHREGPDMIVYMDFHKTLKNKRVNLPPETTGKKFEILEKTPSVTLHAQSTIPSKGLTLDVADGYGTLVLRIKQ